MLLHALLCGVSVCALVSLVQQDRELVSIQLPPFSGHVSEDISQLGYTREFLATPTATQYNVLLAPKKLKHSSFFLTQSLCGPDCGQVTKDVEETLKMGVDVGRYQWQYGRHYQNPHGEHHHISRFLEKRGRGGGSPKFNYLTRKLISG